MFKSRKLTKEEKLNNKVLKNSLKENKRLERIKNLEDKHWYRVWKNSLPILNRFSIPITLIASMLIEIIIESISRHSLFDGIRFIPDNPLGFFYNSFIIFMPFMIVYFFKRRIFARTIVAVLWIVLGIINGVVLSNRVTPFNAQDFKVLSDATTLINNYMKPKELIIIVVSAILLISGLVLLFKKSPLYNGPRKYIYTVVGIGMSVLILFGFTNLALSTRSISNYFGNIAFAYEDYGLPYCFFSSVFNTGIDKPNGYSKSTMNKIAKDSKMADDVNNSGNPNIIFVQLESFMDPSEVSFLHTSEDPIPNFRNLMRNYSSGYFKVPSIGAGTSNTEFECLTGMSMRYFGPGEYPYKTKLKKQKCESAASVLSKFGYNTHAIHNNGGNFYSRADVFNNMGFDTFTSKEEMNVLNETFNGWATDDILLKHINECLDYSENPDFIYTITVQSHGKYPSEKVLLNPEIKVNADNKTTAKNNAWQYYINEIHEVDNFVGDLIDMVNNRKEKTVVVLYGDHLPTMGLKTSEVACKYLYNTEYVIYDNFGLSKKDENLTSYQIMAETLNKIGINSGAVFNYHNNRRKTEEYQEDLELIEYDLLYGNKYLYNTVPRPHIVNHIKFGLSRPSITSIEPSYKGCYIVKGTGFNQNSKVYLNGEKLTTNFWNEGKIVIFDEDLELKLGDELIVNQVGSQSRIFASSEKFIYNKEN